MNAIFRVVSILLVLSTTAFANAGAGVSAKANAGTCYASTGKRGPDAGSLLTIDLETGAGTVVGATGKDAVAGLAINSTGAIYGITVDKLGNASELILIDAADGSAITIGSTGITTMEGIAFDDNNILYGVANDGDLYTIDTTNAQVTLIEDTGVFGAAGLAFDPTDGGLYLSGGGLAEDEIYSVDPVTAAATLIGTTNTDSSATPDIVFDDAGNMFGSKGGGQNDNFLISINKTTGEGSVVGPIGVLAVAGLAFGPARPVSVERQVGLNPVSFALNPNFPNPFNPSTTISFALPQQSVVTLKIYNMLGQEVATLLDENLSAGEHKVVFQASRLPSGVYFYRLQTREFSQVKRLTLLK